ncbi:MAG: Asp-tRNA(Asn)/Glu-tRNA(Gln) amidotransferase subunit GatC [Selenomonadaceae bacterium]|nr:Asp-tRNA(Asn)/Glu-tRNA(Gln) amidotransferase subunit GatC [Selenomonadaceae bacterium]
MKISEQDIKTVASLSRLRIREEEAPDVLFQLNKILNYVENLQAIDTTNIEPTTYALPMQNVFRADVVKPSLDRELALSTAPLQEDGYFKVPRVLEQA